MFVYLTVGVLLHFCDLFNEGDLPIHTGCTRLIKFFVYSIKLINTTNKKSFLFQNNHYEFITYEHKSKRGFYLKIGFKYWHFLFTILNNNQIWYRNAKKA